MMLFESGEIVVALAAPFLLVAVSTIHGLHKRITIYIKSRCVSRIVSMIVAEEEPSDDAMRSLRIRFTNETIRDSIAFISENIYGQALNRLLLIVEECRVDYSPMLHTRLCETAYLIAMYPDYAIRYIARLDVSLSWSEVALLIRLMRRIGTPIAYTPLLTSQNRNLQLIGLFLCEHFAIVDAEQHLQRLVDSSDDEISYIALLALCSIRGDISTPQVGRALGRLLPHQRAAFLRYAVQACYSLRSCAHLLTRKENRLFLQRINSYKCQIVCN